MLSSSNCCLATAAACLVAAVTSAVLPPPWADPSQNPCAAEPSGGWQLLYWPEDGKCYRIFQRGYPCPETMELVPRPDRKGSAECACPPGSVRSSRDFRCHQLFRLGDPCDDGQYFAPGPDRYACRIAQTSDSTLAYTIPFLFLILCRRRRHTHMR